MTDLNELLERVKEATGPDNELDADILKAFGFHSWAGRMRYPQPPEWVDFGGSDITGSVDAALAFVEQALRPKHPGMTMQLRFIWNGRDDRGWCRAEITWPSYEFIGHASTAPLAMIEALLSALISEESQS